MSNSLLIRADASTRIGTGHIMRCLALAQAWRRSGGSAVFVSAEITPALEARLAGEGFQIERLSVPPGTQEDAAKTAEMAETQSSSWIVADGYGFGLDYQRAIKAAGRRLLFLDDYGHAEEYVADFVLNQNLAADPALYARRAPHTRLLLGTRYSMLREEFLKWRDWKREIPQVARKVLVTLGGSDPDNVTARVVEALQGLDVEARIVVGGSNPHFDSLSSAVRPPSSIIRDASNMPELMAWADVAISAGGTTSWELAFMGLPSLVFVLAENQRGNAGALHAANVSRHATPERLSGDLGALLRDGEMRRQYSQQGRRMVDGYGASRVTTCLRSSALELRRVQPDDCRIIWEWANEPEARAMSLSSAPIPWDSHQRWFAARINSPDCLFYLATNGHEARLGQIRYDITDATAVLSVSLAKEARGLGYGPALIRRGSEQCFADSEVGQIRAYIKPENQASVHAFLRAGFADNGNADLAGATMRQFIMERECIL